MSIVIHRAQDRGYAKQGRLESHHSFSFARYYDPNKMGFGTLRVINDDVIDAGQGFGAHPHDNMEIITIPLEGALEHKDNIGGGGIILAGDVQVMSAGSGIIHSEFNASKIEPVSLFQIWIETAEEEAIPRYDQKTFPKAGRNNQLQLLVSPDARSGSLMIHQNAFIGRCDLEAGMSLDYESYDPNNGVYVMIISGSAHIAGTDLKKRDAVGITDLTNINIQAISDLELLIIEVPTEH